MVELYSERNGIRNSIRKTAEIDAGSYVILRNCCDRYRINLAWRFPEICPDKPEVICGVNNELLDVFLKKAVPDFIFGDPAAKHYVLSENPFDGSLVEEREIELSQNFYSVLDYIEFIALWIKTIIKGEFHSFWSHHHLSFSEDNKDFEAFRTEINEAFNTCGLLYQLTKEKIVERIVEDEFIIEESKTVIEATPEKELKKLLEEAVSLHKSKNPNDHHLATEKLWDAFERLRSLYVDKTTDKKASANKIINQIARGNTNYIEIINNEFLELGKLGNRYRIRHSEPDQIELPDNSYYDYFFGRCFSLIVLALKHL